MRFDAIIIGGGKYGMEKATLLQEQGLKCAVVSKGRSLNRPDYTRFQHAGGTLFMGDVAINPEIKDGKVICIHTQNLCDVALEADTFYLATGKFFAGGLVADMNSVYEPVFSLDVKYSENPGEWFDADFEAQQPFMSFGVITDANGNAMIGGESITNLFPIGEILSK